MRFKVFFLIFVNFLIPYRGISDTLQIQEDTIPSTIYNESRKFNFTPIRDVFIDKDSYIWIGQHKQGLIRINGDNYKYFSQGDGGKRSFNAESIYEDAQGVMWIGEAEGFQKFDKEKEVFTTCAFNSFFGKTSYETHVRSMLQLDDDNFAIGTKAGIHIYNQEKDTLSHYLVTGDYEVDGASTSRHVHSMVLDSAQKCIWFTTRSGLGKMMLADYSIEFIVDPYDQKRGQLLMMTGMVLMGNDIYIKYDNSKIIKYNILNKKWQLVYEKALHNFWEGANSKSRINPWLKNFQKIDERYFLTSSRELGVLIFDTKFDKPKTVWIKNPKFSVIDKFENPEWIEHQYLTDTYWAFVDKNGFLLASFGREMYTKTNAPIFLTNKRIEYGELKIEHIFINGEEKEMGRYLPDKDKLTFKSFERDISFIFHLVNPVGDDSIRYRYAVDNSDQWNYTLENDVASFNQLSGGIYDVRLQAYKNDKVISERKLVLEIEKFWHEKWIYRFLIALLFAIPFLMLYTYRLKKIKETSALKNQLAEVEMTVLRAQMNPHFMFNSLNSINQYIVTENPKVASDYLTKFSRLMRRILNNSKQKMVLLQDELDTLDLYIELEQLRFDKSFEYTIQFDQDIDPTAIVVPPLIIQPYVENAIRHGVALVKNRIGKIEVKVSSANDKIKITIDDNGIGREKAIEINSNKRIKKDSHGMSITSDRIELISKIYNVKTEVEIIDKHNENQIPTGTQVLITIPKIKSV